MDGYRFAGGSVRSFNHRNLVCRKPVQFVHQRVDLHVRGLDLLLHEPALLVGLCFPEIFVQRKDLRDKRDNFIVPGFVRKLVEVRWKKKGQECDQQGVAAPGTYLLISTCDPVFAIRSARERISRVTSSLT